MSDDDHTPKFFIIDKRYKIFLNEIGVKETKDELATYMQDSVENLEVMMGTDYDVLS